MQSTRSVPLGRSSALLSFSCSLKMMFWCTTSDTRPPYQVSFTISCLGRTYTSVGQPSKGTNRRWSRTTDLKSITDLQTRIKIPLEVCDKQTASLFDVGNFVLGTNLHKG